MTDDELVLNNWNPGGALTIGPPEVQAEPDTQAEADARFARADGYTFSLKNEAGELREVSILFGQRHWNVAQALGLHMIAEFSRAAEEGVEMPNLYPGIYMDAAMILYLGSIEPLRGSRGEVRRSVNRRLAQIEAGGTGAREQIADWMEFQGLDAGSDRANDAVVLTQQIIDDVWASHITPYPKGGGDDEPGKPPSLSRASTFESSTAPPGSSATTASPTSHTSTGSPTSPATTTNTVCPTAPHSAGTPSKPSTSEPSKEVVKYGNRSKPRIRENLRGADDAGIAPALLREQPSSPD